ncbi:MAG: hypothetical protein ACI4WW_02595 [Candidatus Coprovivens sp.]
MDNVALEKAMEKIYYEIADTGIVTDNQLAFIMIYENKTKNKNKKSDVDKLFDFGNKALKFLNTNFPKE